MEEKVIRDEIEEHREGQRIFTKARVIFGCSVLAAIVAVGLWAILSNREG